MEGLQTMRASMRACGVTSPSSCCGVYVHSRKNTHTQKGLLQSHSHAHTKAIFNASSPRSYAKRFIQLTTQAVTEELSSSGSGSEDSVPWITTGGPLQRLLPPTVHFTNDRSVLTVENVRRLWSETRIHPGASNVKLQLAMDHSFAVQMAVVYERVPRGAAKGTPPTVRLVGWTRSMSDGAFVATICDAAVSPEFQGRGIGRKLVRNLVADMRNHGPSSFAVFPRPEMRDFFSKCGFRLSHQFKMMKFMNGDEDAAESTLVDITQLVRPTIGVLLEKHGNALPTLDQEDHDITLSPDEEGPTPNDEAVELEVEAEGPAPNKIAELAAESLR